jgi:dolichol-phosphate mannosyltransferase
VPRPELSLVIPIYNEAEVLPQLDVRLKELLDKLGMDTEVVFVNDGSRDDSMEILRRMASHEPRYKVLGFSRNFGHQRAITAGMDKSRGRAVVVMDADLQDPPEVILEMVEKWHQGYDVVYGRRRSRAGESWFKLITAKIFYRVFAAMIPIEVPLDTGDFRLMSRRVVTTMRGLRETHRFVRGLVAWVGFRQTAVEYDRAPRAAGETKYPLRKMLAFAMDGIASFSIQPLRFATYIGVIVGTASVLYALAAIISNWLGMTVPGWTTTVVLVSFLFSVQFFMIGVLGEYVGRIYEQIKGRPLYIVSERINFGRRKVEQLVTKDIEEIVAPEAPPVALPGLPPIAASAEAAQGSRPPSAAMPAAPAVPGAPRPLSPRLSSSSMKAASAAQPPQPPQPAGAATSAAQTPASPPAPSIPPRLSAPPAAPARRSTGSVPPRTPAFPSRRPTSAPGPKTSPATKPSTSTPVAKSPSGAPQPKTPSAVPLSVKSPSVASPVKRQSAPPPADKTPSAPPLAGKTPSVAPRDPKDGSKEPPAKPTEPAKDDTQAESAEEHADRFSSMPTKVAAISGDEPDDGDATRVEPRPVIPPAGVPDISGDETPVEPHPLGVPEGRRGDES